MSDSNVSGFHEDAGDEAYREFGYFVGRVVPEWQDDGRTMILQRDFEYVDPEGLRWHARKGSCINGASIPRVLWTPVGAPSEGKYRDASVVHDVACDERTREWQAVHRMFYYAMRAGGVGSLKAKTMYFAVRVWGPEWDLDPDGKAGNVRRRRDEPAEEDIAALERSLIVPVGFNIDGPAEHRELELDEIDRLADRKRPTP